MTFLDQLHAKRRPLAAVLKEHKGIRKFLEQLYPDRAHFLFELLQNAEDAGATEAAFDLQSAGLTFEHDGNPFDERDVEAITDIGEGTKEGREDKVGTFGVGFKAVFDYSETPHIWSPTFSFKISDFVLPTALPTRHELGKRTQFQFPFNNPKKKPTDAFEETEKGISDLAESTLLFLSHLSTIRWGIGNDVSGKIFRCQHSEFHVEVLRESDGKKTGTSHFLKFDRPVEGLEKQRVAVAFELDFLPNVSRFDNNKALTKQLKIVAAAPGRVFVFFPAEKESSELRFHLQAPFVPELSRASIKETPANLPLFEQLATLAAASLHQIRDLGLLSAEFLEVLPNSRDQLDERYGVIRSAIIDEMNDQPLTPTHAKSHAPARHLLTGKASLKHLLSDKDFEFLIDCEDVPWSWAVGVAQKNSKADHFLESLEITQWDVDRFVELLCARTSPAGDTGPPAYVLDWLRGKSTEWHQELYALLADHLESAGHRKDRVATKLGSLRIVRLTDGGYGIGSESFFVNDGIEHNEGLNCVDEGVYSTGKSKAQKANARGFLEEIGVRAVGEAELVEAVLKKRYTYEAEGPDERRYRRDLKRFVQLVKTEPDRAGLFREYYIFNGVDVWRTPDQIFLDQPFRDTGLSVFYAARGDGADRAALSPDYLTCGISLKSLVEFALAVGAAGSLEIERTTCRSNPNVAQLVRAGTTSARYGIDSDYHIPGLAALLPTSDVALSQLIWRTLREQSDDSWTTASHQPNSNYEIRTGPSQLACVLTDRSWIPQTDGRFVRPAEASRDLLPSGFPFDTGWEWLQAIHFGKHLVERSEEQLQIRALAKQLGFDDDDTLDRAKRFALLPVEEQTRILAEREPPFELTDQEPPNPTRRAERVTAQAASAPERTTEERTRSISISRDGVKQEAGEYLRQQYTNSDGQMMCQLCKKRLPFQLDDGSDYFERVEFIKRLKRHHRQNYLALCPNHAAMFQHVNGSIEDLPNLVIGLVGNALWVVLAKRKATIYFTPTHLADLKAIIRADESGAELIREQVMDEFEPSHSADPET